MLECKPPKEHQFKELLNNNSPDFAWEVMLLEINVESSCPSIDDVMKLIQLYMFAVEVLENNNDQRYSYFNHKIYSLMTKKEVIEQLHKATTGHSPDQETLDMIKKKQLENKRSQLQLQVYLQKDSYTISSIKDILKKEETQKQKRTVQIQRQIRHQDQALEQRIKCRKLRSISKGRDFKQPTKLQPKSEYHQQYQIRRGPNPKKEDKNKEKDKYKYDFEQ